MATRLQNYSGFTVEVDGSGNFIGKMQDIEMQADTLAGLRAKIDRFLTKRVAQKKKSMSLAVIGPLVEVNEWSIDYKDRKAAKENVEKLAGSIFSANLVGFNRTSRAAQFDRQPPVGLQLKFYVADTPLNRARVELFVEAERAFDAIVADLNPRKLEMPGYGKIEAEEYEDKIAPVEERHAADVAEWKALDGSEPAADNASVSDNSTNGGNMEETREGQTEGTRETVPGDSNQPAAEQPEGGRPAETGGVEQPEEEPAESR